MLAEHFLRAHTKELGKTIAGFDDEAMAALRRYRYPGNVRELANIIERASVLTRGETIGLSDLPTELITGEPGGLSLALRGGEPREDDGPWTPMALEEAMKGPERRILMRALEANGWNRQQTAEVLGINRTTLYKKMKAYGIEEPRRAG
jgi:DNA-binding NtrC family response regulator